MNKLITVFLILGLIFSITSIAGEENANPVEWKYKASSWIISTSVSNDASYNAASALDGSIYFFDKSGKLLWTGNVGHRVVSFSISETKPEITAVTGERVYIFNKSGKQLSEYKTVQGSYMVINQAGDFIGGSSSNVYAIVYKDARPFWDYRTGDKVNSVSLTSDGSTMAVASSDKSIYLLKSGFLLWKYDVQAPVISVATTPDASYVVCGSGSFDSKEGEGPKDFKVFLFDKNGNLLWDYKVGYTVSSVAITPDGSYIAVGSWDKKVHIFSKSGEHLKEFKTEGNVLSVAITPDGQKVFAGSTDANVYFLDIASMSAPAKESSPKVIFFITPGIIILIIALVIGIKKKKKN
ncbi:MAG: hypothetical protein GYA60_00580 [Candidatus Methanofastidiosa archaeon]|jgi:WD40 repeat protein|nr:hypothetical protein [Candidatus Methanofastidiosa archaeon]